MRKADCQFSVCRIQTVIGGVMIAPRPAPSMKMPTAVERSLAGNHCATAFVAAGKLVASVTPSEIRRMRKLQTLRPRACNIVDRLQSKAAMPKTRFVPKRSMIGPETS